MELSRSEGLQEATKRLDAAVDALESLLRHHLSEDEEGESLGMLRERVRLLTEERDQLCRELDEARTRARRLEMANDEVSGRLEALMASLKDEMSATPQ